MKCYKCSDNLDGLNFGYIVKNDETNFYCNECYNKINSEPIRRYPIGITPKEIWIKQRKREIIEAIERYTKAKIVIPFEWVVELRELEENGV